MSLLDISMMKRVSPTMGGLYFWVCKMKPDLPVLGCKSHKNSLERDV